MNTKKKTREYLLRMMLLLLTAAMFSASTAECFASDTHFSSARDMSRSAVKRHIEKTAHIDEYEKKALYERVNSVLIKFTIRRGLGQGIVLMDAKSAKKMDAAKISMTFMNSKNGKAKTFSGKMEKKGNRYSYNQKYRLPQKGTYYIKVKIRCYNNGKLVETISKTSADSRYDKR